jgi:hypothetical protein
LTRTWSICRCSAVNDCSGMSVTMPDVPILPCGRSIQLPPESASGDCCSRSIATCSSREAAQDYSPRREPWVRVKKGANSSYQIVNKGGEKERKLFEDHEHSSPRLVALGVERTIGVQFELTFAAPSARMSATGESGVTIADL